MKFKNTNALVAFAHRVFSDKFLQEVATIAWVKQSGYIKLIYKRNDQEYNMRIENNKFVIQKYEIQGHKYFGKIYR